MSNAITLSFASYADLDAFIARECEHRQTKRPLATSEYDELAKSIGLVADAVEAINHRLQKVEILGARHIEAIQQLEARTAKVVETNQGLHQRVKAIEEDWPAGVENEAA